MKYRVDKILSWSGHIERNHIHENDVIEFRAVDEKPGLFDFVVNNLSTKTLLDKHEVGKLKKKFQLTELS